MLQEFKKKNQYLKNNPSKPGFLKVQKPKYLKHKFYFMGWSLNPGDGPIKKKG